MINIRGSRLHDQACTACSKGSAWSPFRMTLLNTSTSDAIKPAAAGDGFLKRKPKADELLPVEQAFRFEGVERKGDALSLRWTVAPGYYLYEHMFKVSVDAPAGQAAPKLLPPKGERKQDAEFGEVTVHRGTLAVGLKAAAGTTPKTLRVRYQGCADVGVCYPPQTKLVAVR